MAGKIILVTDFRAIFLFFSFFFTIYPYQQLRSKDDFKDILSRYSFFVSFYTLLGIISYSDIFGRFLGTNSTCKNHFKYIIQ